MNLYNVRMPHACPHLAAPVVEVPKVLVRGEAKIGRNRCEKKLHPRSLTARP